MLQRSEIRGILHHPRLQAKLTVGAPGDAYEREADRVADAVMRMPAPQERVQRVCQECEEELQREPASGQTPKASPIARPVEARIQSLRGAGQRLPESTRSFFEPRFGRDFGGVRIHSGPGASELNAALGARAFTVGRDIVFGAQQYAPHTSRGRKLLAHELTHVVQQGSGTPVAQRKLARSTAPRLKTGGEVVQANANECTYGEIRSWAIVSQSNLTAPGGLPSAKASIGSVCSPRNCSCRSGAGATAPGDQAAWRNIVAASGGADLSGGGNFMCVGHQNCWFVHSCYHCENGRRALTRRATNLATSGSTSVTGKGTLYFYNDPLQGWCNAADRRSGCQGQSSTPETTQPVPETMPEPAPTEATPLLESVPTRDAAHIPETLESP